MGALPYLDRDMQRAIDEINEMREKVQDLEVKMTEIQGEIRTLRAELGK